MAWGEPLRTGKCDMGKGMRAYPTLRRGVVSGRFGILQEIRQNLPGPFGAIEREGWVGQAGVAGWKPGAQGELRALGPRCAAASRKAGPESRAVADGGDAMITHYVQLSDTDKLALLNEHSIQAPFASLATRCWCMHCEKEFDGHSVRVWKGGGHLWLECGTPGCDGSPIDWAPYPWWNARHPATRAARKREREQKAAATRRDSGTSSFAA